MKITKPAVEIEVCDVCRLENCSRPLRACLACGRQYCLTCQGIVVGCWMRPGICRSCGQREDVLAVVAKHAKRITPIVKQRDAEIAALPPTPEAPR